MKGILFVVLILVFTLCYIYYLLYSFIILGFVLAAIFTKKKCQFNM